MVVMLLGVTGGGGRLGNVLVRQLRARGDTVKVLEPRAEVPSSLDGVEVELVHGSVLEPRAVEALVEGVDLLFHLAAKVDLDRDRDGSIHAVNVDGTRVVAEACLARGIRMVHCSSHHALERHPLDEPLDENKPLALDEPCAYHRSKARAEALVRDLVRERGLDAVVVNPGSLVGPYDFEPSMIGRALLDLYHRRIPILMEVVSDYVDVRDVADGILRAAEKGRAGERYLLTGDVLELRDIVGIWGELTSVPMPKRVLPLWVGWAMVPFTIAVARLTGKSALFTPGVLRASVSNRVVSHAKATRELGFEPRSVKDSLAGALQFYRAAGWIGERPLSPPASPAHTPQ
jgi:dihydroflavonol-4-reductase